MFYRRKSGIFRYFKTYFSMAVDCSSGSYDFVIFDSVPGKCTVSQMDHFHCAGYHQRTDQGKEYFFRTTRIKKETRRD